MPSPPREANIGRAIFIHCGLTGFLTRADATNIFATIKRVVMNGSSGDLSVMLGAQAACLRLAGRANFNISHDVRSLLQTLQARGVTRFILDLRGCVLMDSTFIGMLARFSLALSAGAVNGGSSRIELLGAGDRIEDMLDNLGVKELFGRLSSPEDIPAGLAPLDLAGGAAASKRALTETSLDSHRALMELSEENRMKFKEVENCLLEDLKNTPPDAKT